VGAECGHDLGCGDGRIVIAAVRETGARGVCVDIDPRRIAESRENARKAGVADRIQFRNEDLFTTEIGTATVVMLFLYPDLNLKLRPRLLAELKPGARVVSHWHDMGDWTPWGARRERTPAPVHLWIVSPRWSFELQARRSTRFLDSGSLAPVHVVLACRISIVPRGRAPAGMPDRRSLF
jgi:SAM-dependent methyltransferase